MRRRPKTSMLGVPKWMVKGLDAIVINTSGCGTTVKDYGHMFRNDALAEKAARVSEIAMDVSELLMKLDVPEGERQRDGCCISCGLLFAAWTANQNIPQRSVEESRLHGCGACGQPFVLWFSWHLQLDAAGDFRAS